MRSGVLVPRLALCALLAASCTGPGLPPPRVKHHFSTCESPRPEVCTYEYRPVCAHLEAGQWKTYPSWCAACSDATVIGWRPAACETE